MGLRVDVFFSKLLLFNFRQTVKIPFFMKLKHDSSIVAKEHDMSTCLPN